MSVSVAVLKRDEFANRLGASMAFDLMPHTGSHASPTIRRTLVERVGQNNIVLVVVAVPSTRWTNGFLSRQPDVAQGLRWLPLRMWAFCALTVVVTICVALAVARVASSRPSRDHAILRIAIPPVSAGQIGPVPMVQPAQALAPSGNVETVTPRAPRGRLTSPSPLLQPIDRLPAVLDAMDRALKTEVTQPWRAGKLSGYVAVGPIQVEAAFACRSVSVWAEAQGAISGRSIATRRCLAERGEWAVAPMPVAAAAPQLAQPQAPETGRAAQY